MLLNTPPPTLHTWSSYVFYILLLRPIIEIIIAHHCRDLVGTGYIVAKIIPCWHVTKEMHDVLLLLCNQVHNIQWQHQGGHEGVFASQLEALPHLSPPPLEGKNGKNQTFSANFRIFAPWENAFCPLKAPRKFCGATTDNI